MDLAAIFHESRTPMCCMTDPETLQITLRTGREVERAELICADPYEAGIAGGEEAWQGRRIAMEPWLELEHHQLWRIVLKPPFRRLRYVFALTQAQEQWYCYEDGLRPNLQLDGRVQCFQMPWMNPADCIAPPDWVRHTVWYQVYPDRFCRGGSGRPGALPWRHGPVTNAERFGGDLAGIAQKLPYLAGLGVNGLYLNPIFAARSFHKYDTTDYTRVDPDFGTEADLQELVRQAHANGIRVMLDAVFNHCGPGFAPWRDVVEKGPGSAWRDWFFVNRWPVEEGRTDDGRYFSFSFHGGMPKLNTNHPAVQDYLIGLCEDWVRRYDIDGLRFDVGNEISHAFLRRLRVRLKALKPDLYLLGEIWHDAPAWLEGDEYDAVMHYPLQSAVRRFFEDESLPARAFGWQAGRCLAAYAPQVSAAQFTLLDSHDTIRLRSRVRSEDEFWQQLAALFTLPGSPCVYYGTELALEGGRDPDCRRCMPWDELDTDAGRARLDAMRSLIALRRTEPDLQGSAVTFCPRFRAAGPLPPRQRGGLPERRHGPGRPYARRHGAVCPRLGRPDPGPRRHAGAAGLNNQAQPAVYW